MSRRRFCVAGGTALTTVLGSDLFVSRTADSSTAVTAVNSNGFTGEVVDVRRFGVVGDGVSDDTAAMLQAIRTGQSLDIGNLSILISSRLIFNQNGQQIYGHSGGTLRWNGPATDRLLDVRANDVQFHSVVFDGNRQQVKGGLLYWLDNSARPALVKCRITNISGTHVGGTTSNDSNNQYGLIISPYGVEAFNIEACTFDNIANDNSGANGVKPATGLGYTGGIIFTRDTFTNPDTPQTVFSSGAIRRCHFSNIVTVLAKGLTTANQVEYNDADGIRFYGSRAVTTHLPVEVAHCDFVDCGKRAIKGSAARGVSIHDISVVATTNLPYQMVTGVKIDGDDFELRNVIGNFPRSMPVYFMIQSHDSRNIRVDGVSCNTCFEFWSLAPTSGAVVTAGWRVSNLRCDDCTGVGLHQDTLGDHYEDCIFENVYLAADSANHKMAAAALASKTHRLEVTLRNWKVFNADIDVQGWGYQLDNIYQEINDPVYGGHGVNQPLLGAGITPGAAPLRDSIVSNYELHIKAISSGYLSASRPHYYLINGDRTRVLDFRLVTPQ
jgi:hypothetical protein